MVLGYVCETDPFKDRYAWSGLFFKIRESIENAGFQVVWIPFINDNEFVRFFEKIRWKLYSLFGRKLILGGVHFLPVVYGYAKSIRRNESFSKCDVLFFPRGGQISLFLRTKKPIIFYSDATAYLMNNYYWKNCLPLSVKMACFLEKKASQKASLNIRASQWAVNSVVEDCKCNSSRCFVLEFGANIDESDILPIAPYKGGELQVLFSGVEWERKGGEIAVQTVQLLRERGYDAFLNIVGIKELPDDCQKYSFVKNHGFLNKNDPEAYCRYINLFKNSHIMLLPTQAECAGIVFSEAAGFGIPAYTYATGGTESYVVNGVNGYALSPNSGAESFAERISKDIESDNISRLHEGALKMYSERLSWFAWSKRFKILIDQMGLIK